MSFMVQFLATSARDAASWQNTGLPADDEIEQRHPLTRKQCAKPKGCVASGRRNVEFSSFSFRLGGATMPEFFQDHGFDDFIRAILASDSCGILRIDPADSIDLLVLTEIGRAACGERVCTSVKISLVAVSLNKTK